MSDNNNNNQDIRTQGLENLPVLRLLKEPVEHLNELLVRYPTGGAYGWFAWVNSVRTFAYWDTEDETWKLMTADGGNGGGSGTIPPHTHSHQSLTGKNDEVDYQHFTQEEKADILNMVNSGGGGGGTTPSASLHIPSIRVSSVKQGSTRQPDRLMVEPFFMPEELMALNPRIVVLRRRPIKGTFTVRNGLGRPKRCKRKWCYVEPQHTYSQQGVMYLALTELRRRLSTPISQLSISSANTGPGVFRPERGLLLFFNNTNNTGAPAPIRTVTDLGRLFTTITRKGGTDFLGLNTRGTFRSEDFKAVRPTSEVGIRGIIGFALEVNNPDRGNFVRGDSSRPSFLRGAVCEMLLSVNFVRGELRFSLVPR